MFILILTYTQPLPEVDKHVPAHRDYLDKNYAAGNFICSGAQKPRTGGIIVCRAASREEVETIIAEDSFLINGVAKYQIIEFTASKYAAGVESFIDK